MRLSLLALAAFALAACATAPAETAPAGAAPEGRDCFRNADVTGYSLLEDDRTIRISVGPSRAYLLTTQIDARELRWNQAIGLNAGATGWICTGNGLGVEIVGGRPFRQRFFVTSVTRAPQDAPREDEPFDGELDENQRRQRQF